MATGSPEEIEEERRLLYVAMTRAKDDLHLLVPQRLYTHHQPRHGDRHLYATRSRFIPTTLRHLFESPSRLPLSTPPTRATPTGDTMDAGARMREMWR